MANTYLQRTQSGTETDSKKATISAWVKLSQSVGNFNAGIFGTYVAGNYGADGNSQIGWYNGGLYAWFKDGGSTYYKQESTRRFRDNNAWYHVVYRFDMTQSTASNRIRVYLNGEEITSWAATNNPGSTQNIQMNNGGRIVRVGTYNFLNGTHNYLDGLMSHFYFCDGYSYAPTEFGETDSITGEWKIKTSTNVNHGTNGFLILKDGNTITDQSANSNDFVVDYGTLTKTEDNPSNIFATFNALIGKHSNGNTLVPNLDSGNTDAWINSSEWRIAQSTLGASSGKYYAEFKQSNDYGTDYAYIGIWDIDAYAQKISGYPYLADMANCYGLYNANGNVWTGSTNSSYGVSYAQNDIIGCAMDLDNNKIYWSKNGTWMNSANPSSGTGGYSITANKTYAMGVQLYNNAFRANFGNGYFGTTAVSSAGTNASGNGIFEYDVPTGYTALSTKGLNE